MGKISAPLPVKLVMPMLSNRPELFGLAEAALVARFGPVDYHSPRLPFAHTNYYEAEFGKDLQRQFLCFETLVDPGQLAEIKVLTNTLEEGWSEEGQRRINLDPGYLSQAKLVLATTKDHAHRIYIGHGIYAEVTLAYRDKGFRAGPWTYPDYRSESYWQILCTMRGIYVAQLKALRQEL